MVAVKLFKVSSTYTEFYKNVRRQVLNITFQRDDRKRNESNSDYDDDNHHHHHHHHHQKHPPTSTNHQLPPTITTTITFGTNTNTTIMLTVSRNVVQLLVRRNKPTMQFYHHMIYMIRMGKNIANRRLKYLMIYALHIMYTAYYRSRLVEEPSLTTNF
jgi:ABC-type Zn2+ transport system substrate-binding protein/surface adhesin